jgi:hypothetical protein
VVSLSWRALRSVTRAGIPLLLLAGCRQLTLDNPNPPNTAGLQAIYDSPPGELTVPDVSAVVEQFDETDAVLRGADGFSLAQELLESVSSNDDVVKEGEQLDPTAGARLLAVIKVKRICLGSEGVDVVDEERFGSISMTLKASPRGLLPIAWGRFNRCVGVSQLGELTVDGEYSITSRDEAQGKGLLFQFNGTLQSDDMDFEGELDFRIRGNKTTELRVKASNGDVVVAVNRQGSLVVRDRSSEWECDPLAVECKEMGSGQVLTAERAP